MKTSPANISRIFRTLSKRSIPPGPVSASALLAGPPPTFPDIYSWIYSHKVESSMAERASVSSIGRSAATGLPLLRFGSIMPCPRRENLSGEGSIEPVPGGSANLRGPLSNTKFKSAPMMARPICALSSKPAKVRFAGLLELFSHGFSWPVRLKGRTGPFSCITPRSGGLYA